MTISYTISWATGKDPVEPSIFVEKRPIRSARACEDGYFFLEPAAEPILLSLHVIPSLQIQPEALGRSEIPRQDESVRVSFST
jgi:hypothetical protein